MVAEHDQREHLVLAIEKLSCLIHRGAIYERLYPPGTIPADVLSSIQEVLVKLYTTILQLMILCHRIFAKRTIKRMVQAIIKPDEVSALLQECEKLESKVKDEADICERERSQKADATARKLLGILQEPILRTDERVLNVLEKVKDRERLEILDWTSEVLYGSHHETVKDQRTADTCEWVLNNSRFQEWQDISASIILWLSGTGELNYPRKNSYLLESQLELAKLFSLPRQLIASKMLSEAIQIKKGLHSFTAIEMKLSVENHYKS